MKTLHEKSIKRRNAVKRGLFALGSLMALPKFGNAKSAGSNEEKNKAIVGEWFTHFWGKTCDLTIVDKTCFTQYAVEVFAS